MTDTEDLWEDDVKIRRTGYLTDLLGARAVDLVEPSGARGTLALVLLGDGATSEGDTHEAFNVAAEARVLLTRHGVDLSGEQQTKTRKALEYFASAGKEGD